MTLLATPSSAILSNDFGDWVSPILVKEFRQGLKAPWFVGVFLWATVSMPLVMLVSGGDGGATFGMWKYAYWINLAILVHALPLIKGLVMMDEDLSENRLSLLRMTGYTADHLMMCKWLSIMVQAGLIVVTLLPYALIRYYSSADIAYELVTLGLMYLGCGAVAAAAVWLSTLGVVARAIVGLIMVVGVPVLQGLTHGMAGQITGLLTRDTIGAFGYLCLWLVAISFVFMFCMALASAKYDDRLEIHHRF